MTKDVLQETDTKLTETTKTLEVTAKEKEAQRHLVQAHVAAEQALHAEALQASQQSLCSVCPADILQDSLFDCLSIPPPCCVMFVSGSV